jgi:hypothetical protein
MVRSNGQLRIVLQFKTVVKKTHIITRGGRPNNLLQARVDTTGALIKLLILILESLSKLSILVLACNRGCLCTLF